MLPDPPEPFLRLNRLQINSAKKYAWKKCGNYGPSLSKFLASPLRRDESDRCSQGLIE